MQLTIDELIRGKATRIKGKDYLPTEGYVVPFLEKLSQFTDDFRIMAKLPNQMSLTKDNEINLEDTVFNRVWIQAVLPEEYSFDNHQEVVGLVYGLDTRKPVAKIYRGALNMACLNLCVFNPSFLNVQEIEPERPIDFKGIKPLMEQTSDIKVKLEELANTEVIYDQKVINENLGLWVRKTLSTSYNSDYGKVKLATSTAIDAYKLLYEKEDSPYFVKSGETTNMFNIYNAFTQIITDDTKDIMNKAEKTLLLTDLFGI